MRSFWKQLKKCIYRKKHLYLMEGHDIISKQFLSKNIILSHIKENINSEVKKT